MHFSLFYPCRLLFPRPSHLIMLSVSPSLFFKQSLHISIRIGTKNINKDSIRTAIELRWLVLESSNNTSKFHAPTDFEQVE